MKLLYFGVILVFKPHQRKAKGLLLHQNLRVDIRVDSNPLLSVYVEIVFESRNETNLLWVQNRNLVSIL